MFAGLLSSFSPKSILAEKLASALATYFEVKADLIQANLISDTKIILYEISLKPLQVTTAALLSGSVDEIEFSWKWGGDERTPYVRETLLTIRGVKLVLSVGTQVSSEVEADADNFSSSPTPPGYMEQLVQQILDHLTLNVIDVEVLIEPTDGDSKLTVETRLLQLLSFGRQSTDANLAQPPLSQRLSLESLSLCSISPGGEKQWILYPFGYAAGVKRVAGRRFLHFSNGLEITGEVLRQQPLQILLNENRLQAVKHIVRMLLDVNVLSSAAETERANGEAPCLGDRDDSSVAAPDCMSTRFTLPFPGLVVSLSDESKILVPECVFQYKMNGTVCCLSGSRGIQINNECPFLDLAPGATWIIDIAQSRFVVSGAVHVVEQDSWADASESEGGSKIAVLHFDAVETARLQTGMVALRQANSDIMERILHYYAHKDRPAAKAPNPWSVAVHGSIHLAIIGNQLESVHGVLKNISFTMSSSCFSYFAALRTDGAHFSSCSFGETYIELPCIELNSNTHLLVAKSTLCAKADSLETMEKAFSFLMQLFRPYHALISPCNARLNSNVKTVVSSTDTFSVSLPEVHLSLSKPETYLKLRDLLVDGKSLQCTTAELTGAGILMDSAKLLAKTIQLSISQSAESQYILETKKSTNIRLIASAEVSMDFCLAQSTALLSDKFSLTQIRCGGVQTDPSRCSEYFLVTAPFEILSTEILFSGRSHVSFSTLQTARRLSQEFTMAVYDDQSKSADCTLSPSTCCLLPEVLVSIAEPATEIRLQQLTIFGSRLQCNEVNIRGVSMLSPKTEAVFTQIELSYTAMESSHHCIKSTRPLHLCLNVAGSWLKCTVHPFFLKFLRNFSLEAFSSTGVKIGPALFDQSLFVSIPALDWSSAASHANVSGPIKVLFSSFDSVGEARRLLQESIEISGLPNDANLQTNYTFMVKCPEVVVTFLDTETRQTIANDIEASKSLLLCRSLTVLDNDSVCASLAGIELCLDPGIRATIHSIDTISGAISLEQPVEDVCIQYSSDGFVVQAKSLVCRVDAHGHLKSPSDRNDSMSAAPVSLNLNELVVRGIPDAENTTNVRDIQVRTVPDNGRNKADLRFYVRFHELKNKMLQIGLTSASGIFDLQCTDTISDLSLEIAHAEVFAGFSAMQWSNMGKASSVWKFPFCQISSIAAKVSYQGNVVSTSSCLQLNEFKGDHGTTSDDIITYLKSSIIMQVPAFFSNAEVLGENVVEMTGKSVGRTVMKTSLIGSVGGSITGLVAVDAVKGAVTKGKVSRGASEHDRYAFGDFTRGSIRAIGQAARAGAETRRGERDSYEFGDFSVGAASSVGKYASENKSRLAGAGGSGVGMVVGTMLAGPIGFVAGSYIGSRIGASTFATGNEGGADEKLVQNQRQARETLAPDGSKMSPTDHAVPMQPLDPPRTSVAVGADPYECVGGGSSQAFDPYRPLNSHHACATDQQVLSTRSAADASTYARGVKAVPDEDIFGLGTSSYPTRGTNEAWNPSSDSSTPQVSQPSQQQEEKPGYKFGDISRGIIARGKEKSGRSKKDAYVFGDFTRGLFGK